MTDQEKAAIDAMTHEELCRLYRFAPFGDKRFQGRSGDYISARIKAFGGFTPEMSKRIGWKDE